jgi:hypothetical protein
MIRLTRDDPAAAFAANCQASRRITSHFDDLFTKSWRLRATNAPEFSRAARAMLTCPKPLTRR